MKRHRISARRCFDANATRWKKKFNLLAGKRTEGVWGLGCRVCASAGRPGSYATFSIRTKGSLKIANITRHENSREHGDSIYKAHGLPIQKDTAPPSATWTEALEYFRQGRSFRALGGKFGVRAKPRKLAWCLAEAMRNIDRNFFKRVASCTILRDESKSQLVVRFIASDAKAVVRRGQLGIAVNFGTGAVSISRAIRMVFRRFFRRGAGAPKRRHDVPRPASVLDKLLLAKVRRSVELLVADAAKDEELAGVHLARGSRPWFPNVVHLAWDKAHGARRTSLRPRAQHFCLISFIVYRFGWGGFRVWGGW